MTGAVSDTYVAALQHDLVEVPEGAHVLGVVRRPTPWFWAQVDANEPALAPPTELLDAVKVRQAELQTTGLDDAPAHNAAMDEVDYEARYLAHLEESEDARAAIDDLRARLAEGEDVVLVCFENTDEKRCHRTLLRERLERGG